MSNYPNIETAPKDGKVIWAGDNWMIYGRPWRWSDAQDRWLCWFGLEDGFVPVSGNPKHWCPSLAEIANEIVSGERDMPSYYPIYREDRIFNTVTC